MRFFFVSENGDCAGLAWKLLQEGNEVSIFFRNPAARKVLKGMVNQVPSLRMGVFNRPDAIIFDMVGMGKVADELRDEGRPVIGGGAWNDKLELDRTFSMKVMDSFGINAPKSYAFKNLKEASEFAQGHKKLLVLKPNDNLNTAYTYVPKTQDDLIAYMYYLKEDLGVDGKMTLQEFVDGTEVSTEVWYAKGKPVAYPNSTFETKKLMMGDVGPSTGAQTSVVFNYPVRQPRLVQQSLKKIQPFLERIKYTGPLDINGIVRNEKFYGLEFTPRFGYNALYAWLRLLDEPVGGILKRIAEGDDSQFKLKPGFGYALRVSVPPYPYNPEDKNLKRQIYQSTMNLCVSGIDKADWQNVFPLDMYKDKDEYYTAGFDGVVLETTGYGPTCYASELEAVKLFKKLSLPNKQARLGDGAKIAEQRMSALSSMGYEMPTTYSTPIMEIPKPLGATVISIQAEKESTSERSKEIAKEDKELADKLNVRPGSFVDPRIASN